MVWSSVARLLPLPKLTGDPIAALIKRWFRLILTRRCLRPMKTKLLRFALSVALSVCGRVHGDQRAEIYSYLSSGSLSILPRAKASQLHAGMTIEQLRAILGFGYLSPASGVGDIKWWFDDGLQLVLFPPSDCSPTSITTFKRKGPGLKLYWDAHGCPVTITNPLNQVTITIPLKPTTPFTSFAHSQSGETVELWR